MKAIFESNVKTHISLLSQKFSPIKISNKEINRLLKFYRDSTDKVSDENIEKIIACIYCLQIKGVPLKASSIELGLDINDTLCIFKKLRKSSIEYVPLFINLLKNSYSKSMSEQFDLIFKRIAPNVSDRFALATVINMELKKNNSYYGYSEVTIIKYRKMIRDELNGR